MSTQKTIEQMETNDLKALAYDLVLRINSDQQSINLINAELAKRANEQPAGKPEKPAK